MTSAVVAAFDRLRAAIGVSLPTLTGRMRPAIPADFQFLNEPGAEQLRALWTLTSGEEQDTIGVVGGLSLLGPLESERQRRQWLPLMTSGEGLDAVAQPAWDSSRSLDPESVRGVYFAAGWVPLLREPLEANYLAVDLRPLPQGRAGQIILCGRDEDEKCVVAADISSLLDALAADCQASGWRLTQAKSGGRTFEYIERASGRLLTACKQRRFPATR